MKLKPENLTIICDNREKKPFDLDPLRVVRGTLQTGDYSICGLEAHIAIERKSLADLIQCVGRERDRFERELVRLRAYSCRGVIVEATWAQLEGGKWRSQVHPNAAVGSVCSWIAQGVPFFFPGKRERAAKLAARIMYQFANQRWRELNHLRQAVS